MIQRTQQKNAFMSEQLSLDMPSPAAASVLAIGLMSGTSLDGVDIASG